MHSIRVYLVVERVKHGDSVAPMGVHGICEQKETGSMSSAVISSYVFPIRGNEEISMNSFMKKCIDHISPWPIPQEGLRKFQPDASKLVAILWI
jgi:hypothetical protein